jgi:hypothetical protein
MPAIFMTTWEMGFILLAHMEGNGDLVAQVDRAIKGLILKSKFTLLGTRWGRDFS